MSNCLYLFCVETSKKAKTDYQYIRRMIEFCDTKMDAVYRPIYLDTKTKFNDKGIIQRINKEKKDFVGKVFVVYCIDLDDYNTETRDREIFKRIEKYCEKNNYKLIYFVRDIEEVFLGKRIEGNKKVKHALKFYRDGVIDDQLLNRLNRNDKRNMTSNLMDVFEEIGIVKNRG